MVRLVRMLTMPRPLYLLLLRRRLFEASKDGLLDLRLARQDLQGLKVHSL